MRNPKTYKTRALAWAVIAALALAVPAGPALAQGSAADPTSQQYADSLTGAENGAGTSKPAASSPASDSGGDDGGGGLGALPFTGTDLIALAAIAVFMLATGFLLSSFARPRRQ